LPIVSIYFEVPNELVNCVISSVDCYPHDNSNYNFVLKIRIYSGNGSVTAVSQIGPVGLQQCVLLIFLWVVTILLGLYNERVTNPHAMLPAKTCEGGVLLKSPVSQVRSIITGVKLDLHSGIAV